MEIKKYEINRNYYAIIPAKVRYDKSLTSAAKLLYGEITALSNETGYCWASDSYFAELYGVSKTTVQNWLKNLQDCKHISKEVIYKNGSKEIDKRIIKIIHEPIQENLGTYPRKLENPTQENLRDNNTFNNTYKENNKRKFDVQEAFVIFWDKYPNKKAKPKAMTAFKNKCKTTNQFDVILKALDAFIESNDWKKNDGMFIPHPATWLNGERWLDDVAIQKKKPKPKLEDLLPKDFDDLTDEQQRETRMYYQKQIDDGIKNGEYE